MSIKANHIHTGPGDAPLSYKDAMFAANPYINVIFSEAQQPVDCNPAAIAYFGFSSKADLLGNLLPLINASIPAFQPDASPSIPLSTRFAYAIEHGSIEFEIELELRQRRIPMRFTLRKIPFGDSFVIAGYMVDMEQLKEAKNELLRQDYLMRQVNQSATRLMSATTDNFDSSVLRCLKLLARSVNADMMSIWEQAEQDGQLLCRRLYAWDGLNKGTDENTIEINCSRLQGVYTSLSSKKRINSLAAELPLKGVDMLVQKSAKVVLLTPIFLLGEFWGFIALNKSSNSTLFSDLEEKALQSGGIIIVQAILRNQINQSLIAAREAAMASDKAKSNFLSRMSHEIRTPMNAIIGMAAIARKTNDPRQIQQHLEKINIASHQLLNIINDVLDMAKIESGKFEIERAPFDFEKMLHGVLYLFQNRAEENGQELLLELSSGFTRYMVCDELRLSQVLMNLLSNALKFTPRGGSIGVSVRHAPKEGDTFTLHVEVTDTGIGVSEEQQQRLFQAFEQADGSITRRFGGTGLGLSICKSIATLLGGDIWVNSKLHGGSSFIFEVEFTWGGILPAAESERSTGVESYRWPDKRILIVEDVEINREILLSLLEETQVLADTAENGKQAVALFAQDPNRYDLILMDIQMPEMDGLEATRRIRAMDTPAAATVPIIAMTANAFSEDVQACLAAGMNDHIAKPIEMDTMLARLALYLEKGSIQPAPTRG